MIVGQPKVRALVIQMGARRGYEMARMLHVKGALTALQTSAAWHSRESQTWLAGLLRRFYPAAMSRRTINEIPIELVRSTLIPEAVGIVLSRLGFAKTNRYWSEDWFLASVAAAYGLSDANVIVTNMGNGGSSFLRSAKSKGLLIATDVFITPLCDRIEFEEQARWPRWVQSRLTAVQLRANEKSIEEIVAISDLLLCPSDTVVDGLRSVRSFEESKVAKVPYALGTVTIVQSSPVAKRVLFAGAAGLRKGAPYLAEAARSLKPLGYDIRVAGSVADIIRALPECQAMTFLGHLSEREMAEEFESADVFCLPSLAEGMACVTLEALARGVPCVVTRSAGAPISHGSNGLIVPERNSAAITDAVRQICENRAIRADMSQAAFESVEHHQLNVIGDLLHKTISDRLLGRDKC